MPDIASSLGQLSAAILVLAAVTPQRFLESGAPIKKLAGRLRVGLGGEGASPALAHELDAESLSGDLIEVADTLTP